VKPITVYWACAEEAWMAATPPEEVLSGAKKKYTPNLHEPLAEVFSCPAFTDNLKNVYSLKSIYSYEFTKKDGEISTPCFDEKFFKEHVIIRSLDLNFFSFQTKYVFFTDAPSLKTTFYEYPYLEDNNITNRCIPVAGVFDIAKWFKTTEFAFYLKSGVSTFKIESNEVYSYVRFHTEHPIKFVQFSYTETMKEYQKDGFFLTWLRLKKLDTYYSMFKNKKRILKEIKGNLI